MDDRIIPIDKAEKIAGKILDRRRKYALIDEKVCAMVHFTEACSGCFEGGEYMGLASNYGYDKKSGCYVGSGCSECGYTGKRRVSVWIPEEGLRIVD